MSDFGGQWSLKVRGASLRVKTDSDGNDCVEVFSAGEPWPLLEAGDWLCQKALPLVPMLLDELKRQEEIFMAGIEKAKKEARTS